MNAVIKCSDSGYGYKQIVGKSVKSIFSQRSIKNTLTARKKACRCQGVFFV